MAIPNQKFRELVFQLLYSCDMGHSSNDSTLALLSSELATTKKVVYEAQQRVQQILNNLNIIDSRIAQTSRSYTFERIQSAERNILRLAVFELLFDDNTVPPKVAIAEAIRLTKKFSTKEAAAFVNAILDTIHKEQSGTSVDTTSLEDSSKALSDSETIAQQASLELNPQHQDDKNE